MKRKTPAWTMTAVSAGSIALTLLVVFLAANLRTPEAKVEHRIEHLYGNS